MLEDGLRPEQLCAGGGGVDISWRRVVRCLHSGPGPATGDMVPYLAPLTLTMVTLILVTPHPATCSHEDEAAEETTADSLTLTHEWKGKHVA